MCDGMGSFSDADYKRMLLAFDQIHYLLPGELVEFRDISGRSTTIMFPQKVLDERSSFVPSSYRLDDMRRPAILEAAACDLGADPVRAALAAVPADELLYTWRIVNADGDFGAGQSVALDPNRMAEAHLLLLNKFLLAADAQGSIPITGKSYVHALLAAKYRHAEDAIARHAPQLLPVELRESDLRHGPFIVKLVSTYISDAELVARSLDDIRDYKERNRPLFEQFSALLRTFVREVASLPGDASFERDVRELLATRVWKAQSEIQKEMRSAWETMFVAGIRGAITSDAAKAAAKVLGSTIAIGVLPFFSPGTLTWASALAAGGAIAPWVASELANTVARQRKARENGLYYLMGFGR
jgi:hypothetical protein